MNRKTNRNRKKHLWLSTLFLAAAFLCMACGNGTEAATMHLTRTEGSVNVFDEAEKSLAPAENLGLYSGYRIHTLDAGYAWISLDQVKLTKMDQNTQVEIVKEEKALKLQVLEGSLFFHVTEPLADHETMEIRTSTMITGIRGTCGWAESRPGYSLTAVLEGSVECTAPDGAQIRLEAGMMAILEEGSDDFRVQPFTGNEIPEYLRDEVPEILNRFTDDAEDEVPPQPEEDDSGDASFFQLNLPLLPEDGIERTVVTAENEEELYALLTSGDLSNTEIHLTGDLYHAGYPMTDQLGNPYTAESFMLNSWDNLSLIGDGSTRLLVSHENALVLTAYGCDNLLLYGLVLGHDVPPDVPCSEPVLSLSYCSGVRVIGCDIFGCGLVGIQGSNADLTVQNSAIRDCSEHGVLWSGEGNAVFENCSFLRNGGPLFYIYNGGADFTLTDCTIQDNTGDAKRAYFDESGAGAWNETGTVETGNGWQ